MNALEVKGLTKDYPEFTLDKVSFCVPQGHIVGLIGRNGAGKSTTIKGILRLIAAKGAVSVFGKNMDEDEMAVKQIIGYVGGGFRYYPMNTLAAIRKAYAPFYPTWEQDKYERLLAQFELSERKKVKELSEGMKVKFALALALSHGSSWTNRRAGSIRFRVKSFATSYCSLCGKTAFPSSSPRILRPI